MTSLDFSLRITGSPDCPSSKHLGHLSLLFSGGSGSSWVNVKPLAPFVAMRQLKAFPP